ncbi:MAG: methylaspartate ammonia-lyase [Candidatus Aminicenantes bacterium]|nr:MAG: methylaspartate ammonia-lyase [Candidatus Aminicenantes bacterium]
MRILNVVLSKGLTGYYFDDKHSIHKGAKLDGNFYFGNPVTEGFKTIRQAGESVSVMLILDDGQIVYGDCATGQYSGIGGRDKPFFADDLITFIRDKIISNLIGMEITNFRDMSEQIESMKVDGDRLHTGIRYGITQALLDAVAKKENLTMAEVICKEYGTRPSNKMIPIFIQTGDDRYIGTDKGIMKRSDVLPHALIKYIEDEVGNDGEKLLAYAKWIKQRIETIGEKDYLPTIHLDLYGTVGYIFNQDIKKVINYLEELENATKPYPLQLEMPIDMGSKEATMEAFIEIMDAFKQRGIKIKLVVDEWANTAEQMREWTDKKAADIIQIKTIDVGGVNRIIETILYCKEHGMGTYLGGTCNETDISARVCANVAIATSPDQMLAKPGMGVDEPMMIVNNEMSRVLSIIASRKR